MKKVFKYMNDFYIKRLNDIGLYNPFENKIGLVRDHLYSRYDGFNNKVFPELLKHPANCSLILHSKNVSKKSLSLITLDELFEAIIFFDKNYQEQEKCLILINLYKIGYRYNKENYL